VGLRELFLRTDRGAQQLNKALHFEDTLLAASGYYIVSLVMAAAGDRIADLEQLGSVEQRHLLGERAISDHKENEGRCTLVLAVEQAVAVGPAVNVSERLRKLDFILGREATQVFELLRDLILLVARETEGI